MRLCPECRAVYTESFVCPPCLNRARNEPLEVNNYE